MASQLIHKHEKEQFIKLFKQDRIGRFEDRLAVLEFFLQTEHHVTIDELIQHIQTNGHDLSREFVEETIELMCLYGFAHSNQFEDGQIRYEHRHLGQHHDHMICTKCAAILEFENQDIEQLQQQIASAYGFYVLQHKMELYGICSQCRAQRDILMTLDMAKPGEKLIIKSFKGGTQSRLRLLTMGLRIGDIVEIITNQNQGQMVVALDFKRLVLGRGLAQKIQGSPISQPTESDTAIQAKR